MTDEDKEIDDMCDYLVLNARLTEGSEYDNLVHTLNILDTIKDCNLLGYIDTVSRLISRYRTIIYEDTKRDIDDIFDEHKDTKILVIYYMDEYINLYNFQRQEYDSIIKYNPKSGGIHDLTYARAMKYTAIKIFKNILKCLDS